MVNHDTLMISDKISLIGELQHIIRHSIRSAVVASKNNQDELVIQYLVYARQAKEIRRKYMAKHFGDIDEKDWCLCKSSAELRQLLYETNEGDIELLKDVDELIDNIWSNAIGEDLSGCQSCKEDKISEQST